MTDSSTIITTSRPSDRIISRRSSYGKRRRRWRNFLIVPVPSGPPPGKPRPPGNGWLELLALLLKVIGAAAALWKMFGG